MKEFLQKVWRYIVDKMPGELFVSLIVMLVIAIIAIILGHAIKKADPKKPTKGLAMWAETLVTFSDNKVKDILGDAYLPFAPYFLFLVCFIPLAFVTGLFGMPSPMTYYTIPLCLAFVTWVGIQLSAIRFQKLDYLKSFTSPLPSWLPVFVPINMLSKFSPMMSLSIRLFGNALAGTILMTLVYWGTGMLSDLLVVALHIATSSKVNFVGMVVAPVLHAYFDAFSAYIQMTIFTTLTLLFIAAESPAPVNVAKDKKSKKKKKLKAKI